MEVKQIYELTNQTFKEVIGEEAILTEDLSNLGTLGDEVLNANAMDRYVKALVNRIGKVIFVNRIYKGNVPSVMMDGWEFGSVLQKIQCDMPEATENESWELNDGEVYEQDQFYQPKVSVKFFNSKTTFEIPMSFTERQVKQSFTNAGELNAFLSMLFTAVENALTVRFDSLIMRTINNFIGETIYDEYKGVDIKTKTGIKAVNLLKLYNTEMGQELTVAKALKDSEFLKYASMQMGLYVDRLSKMSTLFNVGKKPRFTPKDRLHFVLLSEFEKSTASYLQSDTFHKDLVALPQHETVPYWQGSGIDYNFSSTGTIDIKTFSNNTVKVTGVLGVMFDTYALGVCNVDKRVTSHYNAKAEFYNNWYKNDASYFNDLNENFVVFFVA